MRTTMFPAFVLAVVLPAATLTFAQTRASRTLEIYVIDVEGGGSVNGIVDGLNRIIDLAFVDFRSEGGTMIVPGHGRLCDMADVAYYRDMVTIIRDRVRALIKEGKTLEQVKASNPTRGYNSRYGATSGAWTTTQFVEAIYRSLAPVKS